MNHNHRSLYMMDKSGDPKTSRYDKLSELFGIDYRSLALFRICIAILILWDLIRRSDDLTAHYTDAGVLPRDALISIFHFSRAWLSFHFLGGSALFEGVLFVIAGLLALSLLVGYHTRLVAILSWLMLISLHERNTMILYGGDALLRVLLFWGLFLPLGAKFSIDAAFSSNPPPKSPRLLSIPTVAILIQICIIYWTAVVYKSNRDWLEGNAVAYALNIDQFATDAGIWLRAQKPLLPPLTYLTLIVEGVGPFLAFIPFYTGFFRTLTVLIFALLHFSFGTFLALGLFPFISTTGWLPFLPTWFWDNLLPRLRIFPKKSCTVFYNEAIANCRKWMLLAKTFLLLPSETWHALKENPAPDHQWTLVSAQKEQLTGWEALCHLLKCSTFFWPLAWIMKIPGISTLSQAAYQAMASKKIAGRFHLRPLSTTTSLLENIISGIVFALVCLAALVYTSPILNPSSIIGNKWLLVGNTLHINQAWNMFSRPLKEDGWFIAQGILLSGEEIDLLRPNAPLSWEKPSDIPHLYSNDRWRKYTMNLWWKSNYRHRELYTKYLCREWNATHTGLEKVAIVRLYYMLKVTQRNLNISEPEQTLIWEQDCSPSVLDAKPSE